MKEEIKNIILSYCEGKRHLEFCIEDLDEMVDKIEIATEKAGSSCPSHDLFGFWNPIETAPKQGRILVADNNGVVFIVHYHSGRWIEDDFAATTIEAKRLKLWMPLPSLANPQNQERTVKGGCDES